MPRYLVPSCWLALVLGGCATGPQPQAPAVPPAPAPGVPAPAPAASAERPVLSYRCDQGIEFTVRFSDGSAELDIASKGKKTLLRDAGGVTPQQTVYSSTELKAEFGLGAEGRRAKLNFVAPPIEVRCVRS